MLCPLLVSWLLLASPVARAQVSSKDAQSQGRDSRPDEAKLACRAAEVERGAGIYATRDGGSSWKRLHEAGLFADITSLAFDLQNTDCLYVTTREHYDQATRKMYPGGLFASRDAGRNWDRLLDFRFGQTVAVSPVNPRVLYVGTNDHPYHDAYAAEGLLKSSDGGLTWQRENSGLSHHGVHCLSISPHDASVLYLGTGGNGAFLGQDPAVGSQNSQDPVPKSQARAP